MHELLFMGEAREVFRCRVYTSPTSERNEAERLAFVRALATVGVLDCPAYDVWIDALLIVDWLAATFEPHPGGEGKAKRWRLNNKGRAELARLSGESDEGC